MHRSKSNQHCGSLWRPLSNRFAGRRFRRTWYPERRYRWWQKVPVGMAGSWPGGLQARARAPISRFVLQKDSRDSGYYSLCSRLRWGPIKDLSLWCFNPWLFGEKKKNTPPLNQMVPVACWEQPGSVTGPTCGFNYSVWRGDALERKEIEK